jgi:hypothetical protein
MKPLYPIHQVDDLKIEDLSPSLVIVVPIVSMIGIELPLFNLESNNLLLTDIDDLEKKKRILLHIVNHARHGHKANDLLHN